MSWIRTSIKVNQIDRRITFTHKQYGQFLAASGAQDFNNLFLFKLGIAKIDFGPVSNHGRDDNFRLFFFFLIGIDKIKSVLFVYFDMAY